MSRKHGKSQLRCTQAQCELAALPGTGWRPDFFVGTQRPEEHRVSVMVCTLVFGPWVSVGSQAPCPESQGKDLLFQTSSFCGEAHAVRGPALGGFRICKRLPALHAACPPFLNRKAQGPRVAGRSLLCGSLESPSPEGPAGVRLQPGQAGVAGPSRSSLSLSPWGSLCLSPAPPLAGAWGLGQLVQGPEGREQGTLLRPLPKPPAFARRSRLTFDPFSNSRALLPPFTNSHHFLHDISTMAADFASGLDLLLLLPPGTTPSCCSPLSLPRALEPGWSLESCSSTEFGCLSFHVHCTKRFPFPAHLLASLQGCGPPPPPPPHTQQPLRGGNWAAMAGLCPSKPVGSCDHSHRLELTPSKAVNFVPPQPGSAQHSGCFCARRQSLRCLEPLPVRTGL